MPGSPMAASGRAQIGATTGPRSSTRNRPLSIGSIAVNPADHSVWVGTGEANTNADSYGGQGVFRTSNGGASWSRVGGSELSGFTSYRLVFDGHGTVYDASNNGLWRRSASDTHSAWTLVLKPDPNPTNNPYQTSFITDVVIVPGSGGASVLAADGWRGQGIRLPTRHTTASICPPTMASPGPSPSSR